MPFIHTCAADANSLFNLINCGFIFELIAQEITFIPTFMSMNNDAFGPILVSEDCKTNFTSLMLNLIEKRLITMLPEEYLYRKPDS